MTMTMRWDSEWAKAGKLLTPFVIRHDTEPGTAYVVRTQESITPSSGILEWRIEVKETAKPEFNLFVGVVSARCQRSDDLIKPWLWVANGNGDRWSRQSTYNKGIKENINNEPTTSTFGFRQGDIINVTFNPISQFLTLEVHGKGKTIRRLIGEGLEEVHPCVLVGWNETVEILDRHGMTRQEFEQKQSEEKTLDVHTVNAKLEKLSSMVVGLVQSIERQASEMAEMREQMREHRQSQDALRKSVEDMQRIVAERGLSHLHNG